MKIFPKLRLNISNAYLKQRIQARERYVNKYLKLDHKSIHDGDALYKIEHVGKMVANYARENGVRISVKSATELPKNKSLSPDNTKLRITVSKPHKSSYTCEIDSNTNGTYPATVKKEYTCIKSNTCEDNFLRYFFRKIEDMTNRINKF